MRLSVLTMATQSFKELFKTYRLRAEFDTLSQLGNALAGKGLIYEDSIFSHWQKGSRMPSRNVIIKLIEIFVEKGVITTSHQANELLESAGLGSLTEQEVKKIPLQAHNSIFQVPHEIPHFNARTSFIDFLSYKKEIVGKVVLIHGPAGVGKTALAIKVGHLVQSRFQDGVLWYKVEEDNLSDILLSIARVFGEDISGIRDVQTRATVVRSLLSGRNVLLFLDSAELCPDIHLLIPNGRFCTTIITSQNTDLKLPDHITIELKPFTDSEVLSLFRDILKGRIMPENKESVIHLTHKVGNMPLATNILARQLLNRNISISQLTKLITKDAGLFHSLHHDDKKLYPAIQTSYDKLDSKEKSILISASIFKGKDFCAKSLAYISGISTPGVVSILQKLKERSLIEHSTKNRYRIHPAIQEFVREKLDSPRSSRLIFIAIGIFAFFAVWWIYLQLFVSKNNFIYAQWSAVYGLMALYGGICGVHTSIKWGGIKTLMGKAILLFALGLFAQEFGQIGYSYYTIFHHIQNPYPSIGDLGFAGTIPIYIYGAILLAKSSGIKIGIQSFKKKMLALVIPFTTLITVYILILKDYKFDLNNPIKTLLDFGNPLNETIGISIALIIFIFSRNILDGIMRSKARLLLFALIAQFIADTIYIYKSSEFYGGNYMDLLYLIAYFVMTLALLNLKSLRVTVKN